MKSILELTENEVIHAPTEEIAIQLTNKFHELGLTWSAGTSYLKIRNWNMYKEETCYSVKRSGYANREYFKLKNNTILTIDQLTDFNTEKNNQMQKTTKAKLLSIYKKDGCGEFNSTIELFLKNKFDISDTTEFIIDNSHIEAVRTRGSDAQKKLLKSIGIDVSKSESWSRTMAIGTNTFSYLVDGGVKAPISVQSTVRGKSDAYATGCYPTEELANREAKIITLMILMRNWARFHNELDGFKPDWNASQWKYGVMIYGGNKVVTTSRQGDNELLFGISVKTIHRAEEMLQEFREEIKEIIPFL